jgi:hypothetical protein
VNVSFTGTREGMTEHQSLSLAQWLSRHRNRIAVFAHGCCTGADVQAHKLFRDVCGSSLFIAVYPSTANTRAPIPPDADFVDDPKPPLMRNRLIVEAGRDVLLACPKDMEEQRRGGTWHAVRYARNIGVPVEIFWPKEKL